MLTRERDCYQIVHTPRHESHLLTVTYTNALSGDCAAINAFIVTYVCQPSG